MSKAKTTTEMISDAASDEPCELCHIGGNTPNAETVETMRQAERGESVAEFDTVNELIAWYESEICS